MSKKKTDDAWRKSNYPCNVCDGPAIGRYTLDMDIKGLCFCAEHQKEVQIVYMILLQGNMPDEVTQLTKRWVHK